MHVLGSLHFRISINDSKLDLFWWLRTDEFPSLCQAGTRQQSAFSTLHDTKSSKRTKLVFHKITCFFIDMITLTFQELPIPNQQFPIVVQMLKVLILPSVSERDNLDNLWFKQVR